MKHRQQELPTSEHFTLEAVSEGVYAAIGIKGGAAFSNAGIVDLGDRTLIFDTFETPRAARDLRAAAEELTGRRATQVINSHIHPDHWLGNQVFADATIIATHKIRAEMSPFVEDIQENQQDIAGWKAFIQAEQERLEAETDERRREALAHSIARWQYQMESLPTLELRLPDQTFDDKLVFHGSQRTVELLTQGIGHTISDCYLTLRAEKIMFAGDLAFFQRQPFMPYCDPRAWVAQLEEMENSNFEIFVPGHGPLGTKADVAVQKQYITLLEGLVSRAIEEGETLEELLERPLPAPFDAWSIDGLPQEANVRSLYERMSEQ